MSYWSSNDDTPQKGKSKTLIIFNVHLVHLSESYFSFAWNFIRVFIFQTLAIFSMGNHAKNKLNDARMRQWEEYNSKLTGSKNQIAELFSFKFRMNVMIIIVYTINGCFCGSKVAI